MVIRSLSVLLSLCFVISSLASSGPYDKYVKAVALIHIRNVGICAGGLITPRLVVTAAHCVSDLREYELSWIDKKRSHVGRVILRDFEKDFAVLKLDKDRKAEPFKLRTDYKDIKVGQSIFTIGHPAAALPGGLSFVKLKLQEDLTFVLSKGNIARVGPKMLVGDLSINPGNSGGPVFLPSGEILGVVSGYARAAKLGDNTTIFWRIDEIDKLKNVDTLEKAEKLPWYLAKSNFDALLMFSKDDFSRKHYDGFARQSFVGLSFEFKDRVRFQYMFNYNTDVRIKKYDIGWKHYIKGVRTVPFISLTDYSADSDERQRFRAGLSVELDGLDLFLRYEAPLELVSIGIRF